MRNTQSGRASMGRVLSTTRTREPNRLATGCAFLAASGLVLLAVGTFLPWVKSGVVLRDSYQSISVIRTLNALDGNPLELVLGAWTMIVPVITACAVGYALGLRRTAATISTILAIVCGTVAVVATVVGGGQDVQLGIVRTGPVVTMIGAALCVLGVLGNLAGRRQCAAGDAGGEP